MAMQASSKGERTAKDINVHPLSIEDKIDVLTALHVARAKWRHIGYCLKVKDGDLEAIKSEPGDTEDKLDRVVTIWLRNGKNCAWRTLIAALRHVLVGS